MASFTSADGTSFPLVDGDNLIGRGGREFNGLPVVDVGLLPNATTVSHRHARVFLQGKQWYLKVEEARTPTRVGGREIQRGEQVPLADGAAIQVGEIYLTFRGPSPTPASPPKIEDPNATLPPLTAADTNGPVAVVIAPPPVVPRADTNPVAWPARLPGSTGKPWSRLA